MCTHGYTGRQVGQIDAEIGDRAMMASLSPSSAPRLPPCLPMVIGALGRWSIGVAVARQGRASTPSVSTASCAITGCCFDATLDGQSIRAVTTVGSRLAKA